jgi:hypothetical protein
MTQHTQTGFEVDRHRILQAKLDLVVPFTTPDLTIAALQAARRFGAELNSAIRLLKVQIVPYPLELHESPVALEFLEEWLQKGRLGATVSDLEIHCEIRLSRDLAIGITSALKENSLVLLATRKRPWRTNTERLAASLRKTGYQVMMTGAEKDVPCLM